MLARRRDRGIGQRGNDHVNVRTAGEVAVLGVVVGALHVFDAGRNRNRAAQMSARSGDGLEVRQRVERQIHFAGRPAILVAVYVFQKFRGQRACLEKFRESQPGVDARRNDVGINLVAVGEHHAFGFAVLHDDLRDRGLGADFGAGFAGRIGDGVGNCSGAAAGKSPGAEGAVNFSHVVMQQNVSRSRRTHAEERSDDARRRHRRFEHIGFKPLVQEVDGAHGHQLHLVVFVLAGHALKAAADEQQLHQFFRIERRRIGRHHAQDRLHEAAHGLHRFAEFVVSFGVNFRVPRDLAMSLAVIVDPPQIVAAGHGRESAVERQNFQAVAGKIEIANDLRAQQRDYIGADRELESGKNFFGDGGAAEHVTTLQHQNFFPGARQIGGGGEAVVASSDDDCVVFRVAVGSSHINL